MKGIGFKVTSMFFDRQAVTSKVDAATRRVLSKFGAFVRTASRSSIRKRKKASAPGSPPSSHKGQLRRFIFFSYDRSTNSVVIGPERLGSVGEAPALNEYGGTAQRMRALPRQGGRKAHTKAQAAAYRRKVLAGEITPPVRQKVKYTAVYPARPFMGPAFEKEKPKLAGLWAGAIK